MKWPHYGVHVCILLCNVFLKNFTAEEYDGYVGFVYNKDVVRTGWI